VINAGDIAPDFAATDCLGRAFKLSDYRGKHKVVLFFFPKAFTPACTIEIRAFRDNQKLIESKGAVLVGVSVDNHTRQCDFAKSEHIDFHLIGDESRSISEQYGVVWPVLKIDRRATFLIDEQGKVEDVLHHEVQVYKHLDDVLAKLH
jgi:peroxiredoxin Q/BCP